VIETPIAAWRREEAAAPITADAWLRALETDHREPACLTPVRPEGAAPPSSRATTIDDARP
jgi:hypothetical protein